MAHMIDPRAIPVQVLVTSFLKAMAKGGHEACVVFRIGDRVATAENREGAENMARSVFAIQDGALEVAAIAMHTYRLTPVAADGTDPENKKEVALCSLVVCAGHELEQGGEAVKWDDLPEPIREAHRLAAKAVVAAAVAHKVPETQSSIIKPA